MSFSDRVLGFGAFPNRDTTYEIDQSLMFNGSSSYLHLTPSGAGDRDKWTFSCWVKRGNLSISAETALFGAYDDANNRDVLRFKSSDELELQVLSGGTSYSKKSDAKYRDPSAWYHIVAVYDSANATADYRIRLYVNGSEITSSTGTDPASGTDSTINNSDKHYVGARSSDGNPSLYWDGYMAEVHFIDGSALTPSAFGETNSDTGQWIPKKYNTASGAYGTNGFYFKFVSGAVGTDSSGEGNDYGTANIDNDDVMLDTPTNNFATLNPLWSSSVTTLTQGNLKLTQSSNADDSMIATIGVSSGKWYWEILNLDGNTSLGIANNAASRSDYVGADANGWSYFIDGNKYNGGSASSYGATYTDDDIIGVALDMDDGTLIFYKNNASQGTAFSSLSGTMFPALSTSGASHNVINVANFGQNPSFSGEITAGTATDGNGNGTFKYAPPSGYLALCTANLPTPTIKKGTDYFNTVLYTGDGSADSITGVGFQPDAIWVKARNAAINHKVWDATRGVSKSLRPNSDAAESDDSSENLTSFDSDGFTIKDPDYIVSSRTVAAWNWKANGSGSSDTEGSINTTTTSANTTAGFSISTYTGTGESSNKTVGHGLGVAPSMIIVKKRGATGDWYVYHIGLGTNYNLLLNTNDEPFQPATTGWVSSPTSTTFQLSTGSSSNANVNSSATYVAYCFAEVAGYSACGKYTGDGNANGPMVNIGFRPAFTMIKRTDSTGSWFMYDNKRDTFNAVDEGLFADGTWAESTQTNGMVDYLSNGFKVRNTGTSMNASSGTYIYMAFAESPFKYSNAR